MNTQKNTFAQKKLVSFSKSLKIPYVPGIIKVSSNQYEQKENKDVSFSLPSFQKIQIQKKKEKSVIVESLPMDKKKIWKDKLNSSKLNFLIMKLSKILDLQSTSKEKVLAPFWNQQSTEISKKLWLPIKIDSVDSVLNSSRKSSRDIPMGKSWFSIKKKLPQTKNSLMTSFQLSQYSLPESMVSEVTPSKTKSKKPVKNYKTLKIRLFPNKEEKEKLQSSLSQYRWYYNAAINIVNTHYGKDLMKPSKYSSISLRELINHYEYSETIVEDKIIREFQYNEEKKTPCIPEWWKEKPHSRLPRGAYNKFTSSLNSALSNYKNGNISHFHMKFRSKKNPTDYLNFEDANYPSYINAINSHYWFKKDKKRTTISFKEILKTAGKRGMEIIYEKSTGKYFLHYPVEREWFPEEDSRCENQTMTIPSGNRIISLDPGIRKFLVGYDPTGTSVFFGEGANKKLIKLLYRIDKLENSTKAWKKAKALVSEMHWKCIAYLVKNYDIILMPEFKTAQMVKGKTLSKSTKRLMNMYSFYQFKERLQFKCSQYKKKCLIVDESYTSCTCGNCGKINKVKGSEIYYCSDCALTMARDIAGARNIFLKNIGHLVD